MRKGIVIFGFLLIVSIIAGCEQINKFLETTKKKPEVKVVAPVAVTEEEPKGTKLVKVNNKIITKEEFEQNIKNIQAVSPDYKVDTFEARKAFLDDLIDQELLYQEARSRGIENRKEVKELAGAFSRRLAIEQLLIDATENVTVDAQEIEAFYNQYKDQLAEPEQRRIREIVVSSEDRAREILISLLQGENFATLAKEKSISESSQNAGDIGFIKKDQRGEEYAKFDEIAFSTEVGQVSSIFKGPKGYYLLKVEEIKESKAKLLTDVWEDVKRNLLELKQRQRIIDLTDKLRRDAEIEISEELLK